MIQRYRQLAKRIHTELPDLAREVERAQKYWQVSLTAPDPDPYIDSVALSLHGFYSGVERLFELIATQVDESLPTGETWHRALLDQMARSFPQVRPAVIRPETAAALDEFRRFRHLVRNVYTTNLDPDRMKNLMAEVGSLWEDLEGQFNTFVEFLDHLSHADESG